MSDHKAFNDHIEKLLFIKRLQARENLFDKFLSGQGVLPEGGGLAKGLGLGSGGGLDSSGFKNRKPAIQEQMLSTTKDDNVIRADENIAQLQSVQFEENGIDKRGNRTFKANNNKGEPKTVCRNE